MQVHPDAKSGSYKGSDMQPAEPAEKLRVRREPSRRSSFNSKLGGGIGGRRDFGGSSNTPSHMKPEAGTSSNGPGFGAGAGAPAGGNAAIVRRDAAQAPQTGPPQRLSFALQGPTVSGPMSLPEAAAMAQVRMTPRVPAVCIRHCLRPWAPMLLLASVLRAVRPRVYVCVACAPLYVLTARCAQGTVRSSATSATSIPRLPLVLSVDDDPVNQTVVRSLLSNSGRALWGVCATQSWGSGCTMQDAEHAACTSCMNPARRPLAFFWRSAECHGMPWPEALGPQCV